MENLDYVSVTIFVIIKNIVELFYIGAVNGWMVTTLKKGERGYGTAASYLAWFFSSLTSYVLFLILNSEEFC